MSGESHARLQDLIRACEAVVQNARNTVDGVGAASHLTDKARDAALDRANSKLTAAKKLMADIKLFETSYGWFS